MMTNSIETAISGGHIHGVAGAGKVVIENLIYAPSLELVAALTSSA